MAVKKNSLFSGFIILVLSTVALSDGLPGEFLISDQWRTFFRFYSPLSNPAFMLEQSYSSIRGVISLSPDNVANLWEAGIVVPVGYYHAFGMTVLGENGRSVTDAGSEILFGNSGKNKRSRNNNYLYSLSYAINPAGKLSTGINLNLISQGNFGDPSFGMGMDLGISYRLLYHPLLGYHMIGLTLQNLVSTKTGIYEKMAQSAQIKGDYKISLLQNRLKFHLQADLADFLTNSEKFLSDKKMEWGLFLQAGVRVLPFLSIYTFGEFGDSREIDYWGFTTEINVPQINGGRDLSMAYQYRSDLSDKLDGSHSIYLRGEIGKSREERAASRISQSLSLNANELYNKALKLYHKSDFWNAYFLFIRLWVEYPDFYRNDYVLLHAGSCLEKMDMREESIKTYIGLRESYPSSFLIPQADLGLMRVFYRQGAYSAVNNYFSQLNRPSVEDSIRFHGCYLMGESLLRQSEYRKAIAYFEMVPYNHPDYIFAQHSLASVHALMNSGFHLSTANLENCINTKPSTKEQREIVNRSLVFLGYIFYEENTLSKAVTALRMVPSNSYYYEDALLGLGWAAIKAHQWNDCIDAGLKLAQTSSRFIMQCEGALLQAYGHILEKRYPLAQLLLEAINKRTGDYQKLTEDSLNARKMLYESDRIEYGFFAEKVNRLAKRGTNVNSREPDSLHGVQIKFKGKIDKYLLFADEFKRTAFFERNFNTVKEDIEYALAKVGKIMSNPDRAELLGKDKALTEEIEKLKKEIERIHSDSPPSEE